MPGLRHPKTTHPTHPSGDETYSGQCTIPNCGDRHCGTLTYNGAGKQVDPGDDGPLLQVAGVCGAQECYSGDRGESIPSNGGDKTWSTALLSIRSWSPVYIQYVRRTIKDAGNETEAFLRVPTPNPRTGGKMEQDNGSDAATIHGNKSEGLVSVSGFGSKHSSTGLTPFQVLHGREARLPTHLLSPVEEELYSSDVEYVDQLQQKLKDIFDLVRENNSKASAQQKKYHDRRVNPSNLQPGDTVFLMRPHPKVGISPKLQPRFQGPYALLLILGHNGLVSARGKSFWVHLNHLKLVHVRRREPFDYEGAVEEEAGRESTEQEDLDMTDSEEMTRDLVPREEATTGHDADLRGDQEAEDSSEEESQLEGGRSRYNLRSRRK